MKGFSVSDSQYHNVHLKYILVQLENHVINWSINAVQLLIEILNETTLATAAAYRKAHNRRLMTQPTPPLAFQHFDYLINDFISLENKCADQKIIGNSLQPIGVIITGNLFI